jgi:cathepsin B
MEASSNPFANKPIAEILGMMGTIIDHHENSNDLSQSDASYNTPTSFDSRTQWGACIHPIRDQAQCGSCWAFGASEALSDRFCIASGGAVNVVLSPEDLVECDSANYGCDGGYLSYAWTFMRTNGIASDVCEPYTSGTGKVG